MGGAFQEVDMLLICSLLGFWLRMGLCSSATTAIPIQTRIFTRCSPGGSGSDLWPIAAMVRAGLLAHGAFGGDPALFARKLAPTVGEL